MAWGPEEAATRLARTQPSIDGSLRSLCGSVSFMTPINGLRTSPGYPKRFIRVARDYTVP